MSDLPPPEIGESHALDDLDAGQPSDPKKTKKTRRWSTWSKRRRRLVATGIGVVLIIIVLIAATIGYAIYRNDQIHHIAVGNLNKIPKTGVENILMIGSTSRCALKQQNAAFGLCSQGVNGVNSDVVLIMHLDPVHRRVAILSLPRDTFLPNARPNETNRIDSALVYGPGQLVKVIEQDFGFPINHFVVLNFDSFQGVINALGGINMYFPDPVRDAYSTLKIRRTGCIHLNGFQALAVVRARHMQYKVNGTWYYDGSGDLGRIERDHEFLKVLASALAKRSLGNPLTDNSIFGSIAPQLEVDNGFSLRDIVDLVLTYHGVNVNSAPELTLPVLVDPSFSYLYKGYNYGSIVFPSEPQDQAAIASFTKQPLPGRHLKASGVTVTIEGGIGSPSATQTTASQLKTLGFHVIGTSEVTSVGPVSETDVLYSPGHLAQGERVLDELRGAVALGESTTLDDADVTVVTGSNFSVSLANLTTASSNSTSTTSAKQTTTQTTTNQSPSMMSSTQLVALIESSTLVSSVTANLTAPTPARSTLPSYDPRACPAVKANKAK